MMIKDEHLCCLAIVHSQAMSYRQQKQILLGSQQANLFDPSPIGASERSAWCRQCAELADRFSDSSEMRNIENWCRANGRGLITILDQDYPELLREIPDPPLLLYYHGDRELLRSNSLAVVGSRAASSVGKKNAYNFSRALNEVGLLITSGMASGIDAVAHRAALDGGQGTIAILGTGIDRVYPAANQKLAVEIADRGLLLSEFPLGAAPKREHFPRRNRIISGLSLGVLVVEAARRSGSLITARLAAEQGREVFAIPGSIHNLKAQGCHALIKQGAKLVENLADLIEELGWQKQTVVQSGGDTSLPADLSRALRMILDSMEHETVSVDFLVEQTGLTAAEVSAGLVELEMSGWVVSRPGGFYDRA